MPANLTSRRPPTCQSGLGKREGGVTTNREGEREREVRREGERERSSTKRVCPRRSQSAAQFFFTDFCPSLFSPSLSLPLFHYPLPPHPPVTTPLCCSKAIAVWPPFCLAFKKHLKKHIYTAKAEWAGQRRQSTAGVGVGVHKQRLQFCKLS